MDRDELLDDNDGVFDPENFPEEFREARGKHTNTIAMSLEGAFGLAIRDIVEEVVEDLHEAVMRACELLNAYARYVLEKVMHDDGLSLEGRRKCLDELRFGDQRMIKQAIGHVTANGPLPAKGQYKYPALYNFYEEHYALFVPDGKRKNMTGLSEAIEYAASRLASAFLFMTAYGIENLIHEHLGRLFNQEYEDAVSPDDVKKVTRDIYLITQDLVKSSDGEMKSPEYRHAQVKNIRKQLFLDCIPWSNKMQSLGDIRF